MPVFRSANDSSPQTQKPRSSGQEANLSILAAGMRVVGTLETDGVVRIEGRVEGNLSASGQVLISAGGVVEGDVTTRQAIVAGEVRGQIIASESVELKPGCTVHGDIATPRIKVEEGGEVNGNLRMTDQRGQRDGRGPGQGAGKDQPQQRAEVKPGEVAKADRLELQSVG